ncbi:MAG: PAS domain S-box protein [Pseudomonadota bacterium]|nr:PAS domain S-box protein [Pseudomonadota bacterium]
MDNAAAELVVLGPAWLLIAVLLGIFVGRRGAGSSAGMPQVLATMLLVPLSASLLLLTRADTGTVATHLALAPLVLAGFIGGWPAAAASGLAAILVAFAIAGVELLVVPPLVMACTFAGQAMRALFERSRWTRIEGPVLKLLVHAVAIGILAIAGLATGARLDGSAWLAVLAGLAGALLVAFDARGRILLHTSRSAAEHERALMNESFLAAGIESWVEESRSGRFWRVVRPDQGSDRFVAPDIGDMARFIAHIPVPERGSFATQYQDCQARGEPFCKLHELAGPDGRIFSVETRIRFFPAGGDRSGDAVWLVVDRTEENRALRDAEIRNAALDSADCGVLITSAGGDEPAIYANRRFCEITGYELSEILGRNCRFLNNGKDSLPERQKLREAVAAGKAVHVVIRNRRKDGSEFWNDIQVSPVRDGRGRVTHFVSVNRDVSDWITARNEVRSARDYLEAILNASPDAILTVDDNGNIETFNRSAEHLFGWAAPDIVGKSVNILVPELVEGHHSALMRKFLANAADAGATRQMLGGRIVPARRRDGSSVPVLVSLSRFRRDDGWGVIVAAHDMTELSQANRKLQEISDTLAEKLEDAQKANVAKDQFIANMSHELRTPLNAVIGYAEMIQHIGPDRIQPDKLVEYIDNIQSSGKHLLGLIEDILEIARIENNQKAMEIVAAPVVDVVRESITTVRHLSDDKELNISCRVPEEDVALYNPRALRQSLINLLSNAIKYSQPGGAVRVLSRRLDGRLYLTVEDEGPGMDFKILSAIGQPFVRGADARLARPDGMGLGLAITRRLVHLQGGKLSIRSAEGQGTAITISLPTPAGDAEAQAARQA